MKFKLASLSLCFVAAACGGPDDGLDLSIDALTATERDLTEVAIPDNDVQGISRTLDMDLAGEVVTQVRVVVVVRHSYRGDLRVTLRSSEGTIVVLHDETGGGAQNLRIDTTLSTEFAGELASGGWTLGVSDLAAWDTGSLVGWALRVRSEPAADACDTTTCGADEFCQLQPVQCLVAPCPEIAVCINYCATVRCPGGTVCEVNQVQCVRAPCPPVAECVPVTCAPEDCGPPPPVAPLTCADGSIGTQVSCELSGLGACAWNVTNNCPEPPQGDFCGSRGNEIYCAVGEYCHHEPSQICGRADAQGSCRVRPRICTQQYQPVCGCDDVTYSNACSASASGKSVQYNGPCAPRWQAEAVNYETGNPYTNNQSYLVTYTSPIASDRVRIYFARFNTEYGYDYLTLVDARGNVITRYAGDLGAFETEIDVPHGSFTVQFETDGSVTRSGVAIERLEWAY